MKTACIECKYEESDEEDEDSTIDKQTIESHHSVKPKLTDEEIETITIVENPRKAEHCIKYAITV